MPGLVSGPTLDGDDSQSQLVEAGKPLFLLNEECYLAGRERTVRTMFRSEETNQVDVGSVGQQIDQPSVIDHRGLVHDCANPQSLRDSKPESASASAPVRIGGAAGSVVVLDSRSAVEAMTELDGAAWMTGAVVDA